MRILGVIAALAAVLSLSGCTSSAERDYLDAIAGEGWVTNTSSEQEAALQYGYDSCQLRRDGFNPFSVAYSRTQRWAIPWAHNYLCPELP